MTHLVRSMMVTWPHEWKYTLFLCHNLQNGVLQAQRNSAPVDFAWTFSSCVAQLCGTDILVPILWVLAGLPLSFALAAVPLQETFLPSLCPSSHLYPTVSLPIFTLPRYFFLNPLSVLSSFIFSPHQTHSHVDHSIRGLGGPPSINKTGLKGSPAFSQLLVWVCFFPYRFLLFHHWT